jgi:hypothetical protein
MVEANTKSMKRCKSHYCEKVWLKRQEKFARSIRNALAKNLKKKGNISSKRAFDKGFKKGFRKSLKTLDTCRKAHCNPGCKGTIFQDGKAFPQKEIEEEYFKKLGNLKTRKTKKQIRGAVKSIVSAMKETRKRIFKGRSSVLDKNSFYKGLTRKNAVSAKKDGALSGCTMMILG